MARNVTGFIRIPFKEAPKTDADAYMAFPDLPVTLDLSSCAVFILLYERNDDDGFAGHIEIKQKIRRQPAINPFPPETEPGT